MMQAPKIDESQFQDILRRVRELVPYYTPEWKATEEQDPGVVLLKLFAYMAETVLNRLDRAPDKNFVAFLEMLGVKLVSAQPARSPLTFILSSGASENVLIPERTQAAAGELIFETEKNMVAAPSALSDAYSVVPDADGVFKSPTEAIQGKPASPLTAHLVYQTEAGTTQLFLDDASGLAKGDVLQIGEAEYVIVSDISDDMVSLVHPLNRPQKAAAPVNKVSEFELFQGKNRQEHIIYFAHKDLFQIKPAPGDPSSLSLKIAVLEPGQPAIPLEWAYWGTDQTTGKDAWIVSTPEMDGTAGFIKNGTVVLPIVSEITETEIRGTKSRWLRCKVSKPLSREAKLPMLGAVSVATENKVAPDLAFSNDVPLDLSVNEKTHNFKEYVYPFGQKPRTFDTFYLGSKEAFSKKGARIILDVSSPGTGDVPILDIYGIGPIFAKRLLEAGIETIEDLLKRSAKELLDILKTNKEDLVANIISAAKKKYIEASRRKKQMQVAGRKGESGASLAEVNLSWEYWNGDGWTVIKGLHDDTESFQVDGKVTFTCPEDIASTKAGGQDSYWIRVKIAGGDYGKDMVYNQTNNEWVPGDIYPPLFSRLAIDYALDKQQLESCFSYNNLEFADLSEQAKTSDRPFKPFVPLEDAHQAMYLGFEKRLQGGPLSIFFSIEEAKYVEDSLPRVEWEYFADKELTKAWTRLEALDGTRNLTRTGTLEFVAPPDFVATSVFGKDLFWLRAVDVEDRFESLPKIYARIVEKLPLKYKNRRYLAGYFAPDVKDETIEIPRLGDRGVVSKPTPVLPCSRSYGDSFQTLWGSPPEMRGYAPNPRLRGIYLNTTWAVQSETVKDEILGSSDGTAGQTFTLIKTPVTSADLWVNEFNALSEAEMTAMLADDSIQAKLTKDDGGDTKEFWVRWHAVDSLLESVKTDRHYELDGITGKLKFGDGENGAIPPIGTNNIKTDYRSGGGSKGNVEDARITGLKTSLPFVDKVSNPVASAGGSDTEQLENALERGPQTVRNRGRAVGAEDFEWLAKQASPAIARAKCLPNFDDRGERKPGWVMVIIVPNSQDDKPQPSLELQSRVETYLRERSANTVIAPNHLQVSGPVYVAVSVETEMACTLIDVIPLVEKETFSRLKSFLHPLSGGYGGRGWDFGKMPCLSDFFALLERIPGVDHVKSLTVRVKAGEGKTATELVVSLDKPSNIALPPYTLIFSDEHKVTVAFQKES